MRLLKSQKGSAIIITMIVIVVMSFLGIALWQYGMNSSHQTQNDFLQKQSYYIAKSGADAVLDFILNSSSTESVKNYIDKVNGKTSLPTTLGDGSFTIKLTRDGKNINIDSVSQFRGESSTVSAYVKEDIINGFPSLVFPNVLFSTEDIALSGSVDITGGVEAKGTARINGMQQSSFKESSAKNYPMVNFPSNTSTTNISVGNTQTYTISASASYNTIQVASGGILTFSLNGSDRVVYVNTLDIDGEMTINGTGRLYLYVRNFWGSGEVNANPTLPLSSFIVIMPSTGDYAISRFKGMLYAPGTPVSLSGGTTFMGAMVAGNITNNGDPKITYSPDAQSISPDDFSSVNVTSTTTIEYYMGRWR